MTSPIRILLADDHSVVRAGIRQFLERAADLRVVAEADDGDAARRLIAQHRPDVAVLDIQMPRATGIEVAGWSRANVPTTGILILTAYDDDPYVQAGLAAGANGYVLKTAAPDEMVQAVRDVYEGKQVLDPAIRARAVARLGGEFEPLSERELEVLALAARCEDGQGGEVGGKRGAVGQGHGRRRVLGVAGQTGDSRRPSLQLLLHRCRRSAGGPFVALADHLAHRPLVQRQAAKGDGRQQQRQRQDDEEE